MAKCRRCPAEAGRFKRCLACRRACNAIQQAWRARDRKHAAKLNRDSYARCIEAGKCSRCGDQAVSTSACQSCLDYVGARYAATRAPKRQPRTCNRCGSTSHIASNHRCPARYAVDRNEYALARSAA